MEALILRRNYPVPVTFADLRQARCDSDFVAPWEAAHAMGIGTGKRRAAKFRRRPVSVTIARWWAASIKSATGATDDVYAVVDGREVHVARTSYDEVFLTSTPFGEKVAALMEKADEQGYWERPHEVRLDLQERAPSLKAIDAVVQRSLIEAEVRR